MQAFSLPCKARTKRVLNFLFMKMIRAVHSALFLASVCFFTPVGGVAGAEPVVGTMADFKLALTFSSIAPGTFSRSDTGVLELDDDDKRIPSFQEQYQILDEQGTGVSVIEYNYKAVVERYGVRELLTDLLEFTNAFPAGTSSIAGWSIKEVRNATGDVTLYYLFKKGATPRRLEPAWVSLTVESVHLKGAFKGQIKMSKKKVVSSSFTGGLAIKGLATLKISGLTALGLGKASYKGKYLNVGAAQPVAVSMTTFQATGLVGRLGVGADIAALRMVEGTAATSAIVAVPDLLVVFPDIMGAP